MNREENEIRKKLEQLDCASLCDASPLVRTMSPGLIALHPELKMIGRAHPVGCSNDYLTVIKAVSEAHEGEVLVIDGRRQNQAVFGELLAAEAKRRELTGAVVDGAVRDVGGMREIKFPVYYRWTNPKAGRAEVIEPPIEVVSACGVTVINGDWVFGDSDGVVVIPQAQVDSIVAVALEIQSVEEKVFKSIKKGASLTEIMRFEEFRRDHEREIRSNLTYHLSGK